MISRESTADHTSLASESSQSLRIDGHPILSHGLSQHEPASVRFLFNGKQILARDGEAISSALYAAGISVFGHHHRDGAPQGIYCVNGQCSQCTVLVDGRPLKSCMTLVREGMVVQSCEGRPALPVDDTPGIGRFPDETAVRVLILGGGPAGLCAAIELGRLGIEVLVVDDKPSLGGKLTLQTHQFFGSVDDCWAGTRGMDIGHLLEQELRALPNVKVWLNSTALGVFCDGNIGIVTPAGYKLVRAESLLVALGAREKSLSFPGCDLPGVYGAGAFQTLVNRDLIRACSRLFVLGGGNVGLIGAYHALQAGIDVVGLVEALPEVGGYKVHADKIRRLGIPIWTKTTVLRATPAEGKESVGYVTIASVDNHFQPIAGTERTFEVDTLLIAVGLNPVDELVAKAKELGIHAYTAGDTAEIAEASAAIFSGRIVGRQMAQDLGVSVEIPAYWPDLAATLRSRPGKTIPFVTQDLKQPVFPIIRCVQEIPCNPCQQACPEHLISMPGSIMSLPTFAGNCLGCGRCVSVCPGLAINLVFNDYDPSGKKSLLMLPFEFATSRIPLGSEVDTVDIEGKPVGKGTVIAFRSREDQDRRHLLLVEVPSEHKLLVAGFTIRQPSTLSEDHCKSDSNHEENTHEDPIVCRCERVRRSEIIREIRAGVRDMNQLKAIVRAGMGGCGGKTCNELIRRVFREEGVDLTSITAGTVRPLMAETPLGSFVRTEDGES